MRHPSRDSRFSLGWTLALTSLVFFMVGLDTLVVVTALPAIHRDLGASLASLQWTVNAYSLAWASSITTAGSLFARAMLVSHCLLIEARTTPPSTSDSAPCSCARRRPEALRYRFV